MITILADENNSGVGRKLYEGFLARNIEADYISVENVEVKPCYSCGGCTDKTYGKCVVRDDGDWIYPKLVKSDTMILVTPIVFGSYSFKLKRVYDKCAVIGDRHYKVRNHELVKCGLAKISHIYAVGVKDHCTEEEKAAFQALVRENIIITSTQGKAYVVNNDIDHNAINEMVGEMSI